MCINIYWCKNSGLGYMKTKTKTTPDLMVQGYQQDYNTGNIRARIRLTSNRMLLEDTCNNRKNIGINS